MKKTIGRHNNRMAQPAKSPALTLAFLVVLVDLIGFGMLIPIQPFLAQSLGARAGVITLLGATYSVMQFFFAPFWGRMSDRIGRRPVMLASIVLTGLGHLLFSLADSLTVLFASRALAGFGAANVAAAQAIVADVTSPEDRAKGMGLIGAAFGIGFVLGPAFGGVLGQYGASTPSLAAAILSTCNFVFAMWYLPETLNPAHSAAAQRLSLGSMISRARAVPSARLRVYFLTTFVSTVGFAMMEQSIGLFIEAHWTSGASRFEKAAALTAIFMVIVGVALAFVQGRLVGKLSRKYGESKLARTGLLVLSCGMAAVAMSAIGIPFGLFAVTGVVLATGWGLFHPALNALVSRNSGADEQGRQLALNQSCSALGRVVGPACAGVLFEVGAAMPFLCAGVLMLTVLYALSRTESDPLPTFAAGRPHDDPLAAK